MKSNVLKNLLGMALAAAALWIGPVRVAAEEAPKLLPFQGRLTDASGTPVANGVRLALFRIYTDPASGTPVWAGELHRTTVNGGLVNVMLGAKTPLTGVDFNVQLYLEITVDINGDSAITASDPPMLPRQAILPAVFAKEAAVARDSEKLNGYRFDNMPSAPPVGGVMMFWGSTTNLPPGWEICDGSMPSTPGSMLTVRKPDMRNRFAKGLADMGTEDAALRNETGGNNQTPAFRTDPHALTVAEMPSHNHSIVDPGHSHPQNVTANPGQGGAYRSDFREDINFLGKYLQGVNTEPAATGIFVNFTGGNAGHSHSIAAHDNQPAFVGMLFIIRVK